MPGAAARSDRAAVPGGERFSLGFGVSRGRTGKDRIGMEVEVSDSKEPGIGHLEQ